MYWAIGLFWAITLNNEYSFAIAMSGMLAELWHVTTNPDMKKSMNQALQWLRDRRKSRT